MLRTILLFLLLAAPAMLQARDIQGVAVPETVAQPDGAVLRLNGAGVRRKFFFRIYVGALYLPRATRDAGRILATDQPNRVWMHFLFGHAGKGRIRGGWTEGFRNNLDPGALRRLAARLATFNGWFPDLGKGDEVILDYRPGQGTRVVIRGQEKGVIPGADFNHALLAVWLGRKPADEALKQAMLGR